MDHPTAITKHTFMKFWLYFLIGASAVVANLQASSVNWSAGIHHGFSLENGEELPVGSLVRLGWFRNPETGVQLTDLEIQAMKTSLSDLDAAFVEAGRSSIGSGFAPALPGHFAAVNVVGAGANLVGKQIYMWVLNAPTLESADEQAIFYWTANDTTSNPDSTADSPGVRWRFPETVIFPGSTTIDLTDLTVGTGPLAAGARLLVGTYPTGVSNASGFANFGLSNLYQPPVVVTSVVMAGGSVGVEYAQTLTAAEGTPSFSWEIIGGELPNGLMLDSQGLVKGRPTFPGLFRFIVRVTDAVGSAVSRELSITIASVPLEITSPSNLPEVGLNDLYALNMTANGGTAPYRWEIQSGALPNGVEISSEGLLFGTPTVSGLAQFVVKCVDAGSLETTKTLSLNVLELVISTRASLKNGILGAPYLLELVALGGRPPYTWSLIGGSMPPGQLPGSILNPNGMIAFTPAVEGTSVFTLEARDASNLATTRQFTLKVLLAEVVPSVDRPVFPEGVIGARYSFRLTGSSNTSRFSAKGLPLGLELNASTGEITGRPIVSGRFSVTVSTSNAAGKSAAVAEVLAVRPFSGGRYIGSIAHDEQINGNLGGRFDLSTTPSGSYSLKLTQGGIVKSFRGKLDGEIDGTPLIQLTTGTDQVSIKLNQFLATGTIARSGDGGTEVALYGWRSVWNFNKNPAIQYRGFYSAGIEVQSVPLAETRVLPEGTGYVYFEVKRGGSLTVLGRVADGSAIVTKGFLGPAGEILVHQSLYGLGGSVTGRLKLRPDAGGDLLKNEIEGALTWLKPSVSTRNYRAGFGPLSLVLSGKYLAPAATSFAVSGQPEPNLPAMLNFAGGGVKDSASDPTVAFQVTDQRRVVLPIAGSAGNPARTTLKMPFVNIGGVGVNGQISGTFRLVDDTLIRNVKFQGMIIRGLDNTTKAYGYFLLPQLPTGSEGLLTTPILSGQVTISQ